MATCSRCGVDHIGPDAMERLLKASRAETRENDRIHNMLMSGRDDGRRGTNEAFLRMTGAMYCVVNNVVFEPPTPTPTAWEVLMNAED